METVYTPNRLRPEGMGGAPRPPKWDKPFVVFLFYLAFLALIAFFLYARYIE